MKQANNNEVDLLLRGLARRAEGAPKLNSAGNSEPQSGHLDADELSSFAEGVLPEPARVRYMEHLADCENCRGIVVDLTRSAGLASPREVPNPETGLSFWQKLGAFFSPQVLRYAVPAIALTAVLGISFLALRQRPSSELVAQNQPNSSVAPETVKPSDVPAALPSNSASPVIPVPSQPALVAETTKEKNQPLEDKGLLAKAPAGVGESIATPSLDRDAPVVASKAAESRGVFAAEPNAEPPPPPRPKRIGEDDEKMRNETLADQQVRDQRQEEYKTQPNDVSGPQRSRAERPNTVQLKREANEITTGAGRSGPRKDKKDAGSPVETETRSVFGRSFRRQGNAWVDTDYDSGRATVNVSRGSEQFRALVADEPGIGKIASQLGGEVIVVWKGRAYRIR